MMSSAYEGVANPKFSEPGKVYHCQLEYDNGATIKIVQMIVFAINETHAINICYDHLCKHSDECIRSRAINEIELTPGTGFILGKI